MTMYDGVEAQPHVFLVSVLDIGACSVSRLGDLKHGQNIPSRLGGGSVAQPV